MKKKTVYNKYLYLLPTLFTFFLFSHENLYKCYNIVIAKCFKKYTKTGGTYLHNN